MNLLEFLSRLPAYMDDFEVNLTYMFENCCKCCKEHFYEEDEEYSSEGAKVKEFKSDSWSDGYDWIYTDFKIDELSGLQIDVLKKCVNIKIIQYDYAGDGNYICKKCENEN